jgi:hypothetical protein
MLEGEFAHTTLPYKVSATRDYMQTLADKYNTHRLNVEIPTPEGHTMDSAKNRGYIDRNQEAKVVDIEIDGTKMAALEMGFDIRDPETKRAAAAGTLGRSVAIEDDYRYSTPDGAVCELGSFLQHVAFTSYPIITNMPALEPVKELSNDGTETQFVPLVEQKQLASRLVTWQDPPADVTNGSRKATHQECGYTAGTPEANCDRCLSRSYESMSTDRNPMAQPSIVCAWVGNPIQVSGVCKYFRPRYYSYSKKINGETVVLMSESTVMRKSADDLSCGKPTQSLDSVLEAAWASLLGESKPSEKELDMDVKLLAKELGVAETEDVKAFAKSVTDSVSKSASSVAIIAFAKDGFGIEVTDATKAAELIKAELAKPHTETTVQLSKLTAELTETKTHLAEFAKTNAELAKANADRVITEQLTGLAGRIHLAKERNQMVKADEERILTIATEGDKAIQFVLQFSKDAKYDGAWTRQLDRILAKLEEIELRPKGFAVKGETTKKNLSRFEVDPATLDTGETDVKKERQAGKDRAARLTGKKATVAAA